VKALLRILIKQVEIFAPDDIRPTFRLPVTADGQVVDGSESRSPRYAGPRTEAAGAVRTTTAQVEAAGIEPASTIARRERLQAYSGISIRLSGCPRTGHLSG